MTRQDRSALIDVREQRHLSIPQPMELRADDHNPDELILSGYASTFEQYDMHGGPEKLGWIEQLDRRAFDKTLREKPDLCLLINHEGMSLARTKSGTLQLHVDDTGLRAEARLDRNNPDVQRLESGMRRGDITEMSFAFWVKRQEWRAAPGFEDDEQSLRTILEVSLHKGDVSVVNYGANPTTSAELASVPAAVTALARMSGADLAEVRCDDADLASARALLDSLATPEAPEPRGMTLRDALIQQGITP